MAVAAGRLAEVEEEAKQQQDNIANLEAKHALAKSEIEGLQRNIEVLKMKLHSESFHRAAVEEVAKEQQDSITNLEEQHAKLGAQQIQVEAEDAKEMEELRGQLAELTVAAARLAEKR